MINLLPTEDKVLIRAARQNTILLRYVLLFSLVLLLTLGSFGGGFYAAQHTKLLAEQALKNEDIKAGKYAATKKAAEDFAKDLATAKSVFSDGISYSQLLLDIAEVIPAGTVINSLNLSGNSFGSSLNIAGKAKDLGKVEELKNKLETSDLFEGVSIASLTVGDPSNKDSAYQYDVSFKATLSKPKDEGKYR